MKKLFCIITVLVFMLLCGCNNKSADVTAITESLYFTAEIEADDENYIFDVKIPEKSKIILKTVSPERIKDTVYEVSDSTIKISCGELLYTASLLDLPESSPVKYISCVFFNASDKKDSVEFENNQHFIRGKAEKYDYKLFLGTSGLPIKITDSKTGLTAFIKQATIKP